MRKVEMQMNTAIRNRVNWSGGNTTVMIDPENADRQLYTYMVTELLRYVASLSQSLMVGGKLLPLSLDSTHY